MSVKYDLNKMLEEIKEDEKVDGSKVRKVSQNEIRRIIRSKQRNKEGNADDQT